MPSEVREQVPTYEAVRSIYREPNVRTDYTVEAHEPNQAAVMDFLVSREFAAARVRAALDRMTGRSKV